MPRGAEGVVYLLGLPGTTVVPSAGLQASTADPQLLPAWEPVSPVTCNQQHLVSLSGGRVPRRLGGAAP